MCFNEDFDGDGIIGCRPSRSQHQRVVPVAEVATANRGRPGRLGTLRRMLAADIWHWWIGVIMARGRSSP